MEQIEKLARFKWNHQNHSEYTKILQGSANCLPLKIACLIFTSKWVRGLNPQQIIIFLLSFLFNMLYIIDFDRQPNIFMNCVAVKVFLYIQYLQCFFCHIDIGHCAHGAWLVLDLKQEKRNSKVDKC